MACRLYNTERCLQHQLFNRPNFGVHFSICHTVSATLLVLENVTSCFLLSVESKNLS